MRSRLLGSHCCGRLFVLWKGLCGFKCLMRGSFFLPLPPILLPFLVLVVPVGLLVALLPVFNVLALVFEVVCTFAIVLFPAALLAVLLAVLFAVLFAVLPVVVCPRATVPTRVVRGSLAMFVVFSSPCAAF